MEQGSINQALQVRRESNLQAYRRPVYPSWPSSRPGPRITPPPPGMYPINALRSEQVREVENDDEQVGATSISDQTTTAQEALQRRKKRL